MGSVQVGKAVLVKESYTILGIQPSTFFYPGKYNSYPIIVSVGLKKTLTMYLSYDSTSSIPIMDNSS